MGVVARGGANFGPLHYKKYLILRNYKGRRGTMGAMAPPAPTWFVPAAREQAFIKARFKALGEQKPFF